MPTCKEHEICDATTSKKTFIIPDFLDGLLQFQAMKKAIKSGPISYDEFRNYCFDLAQCIDLSPDNYSLYGDYASVLLHANVILKNQSEKADYPKLLSSLNSVICEAMRRKYCICEWEKIAESYVKFIRNNKVQLDEFCSMCSFLEQSIAAEMERSVCLELAHALNCSIVIGINSLIDEETCRRNRFALIGMIDSLEKEKKETFTR